MKSRFKFSLVAVGLAGAAVSCFAGGKVELVPVSEVRILDTSVFAPAVKANVAYPGQFFSETYPIPPAAAAARADGKIRVTFAATNGGLAGGVFDVRLMSVE